MKNTYIPLFVVALAAICPPNTGYGADDIFVQRPTLSGPDYMPGEIIVKFRPGTHENIIAQINAKNNAKVAYTSQFDDFRVLSFPETIPPQAMVNIYAHNPNVEYAELNHIAHADMIPNDPDYMNHQWNLDNATYGGIGMERAWELSTGAGVVVAVVDTGVKLNGPDGVPAFGGYDFVNHDTNPTDDHGHGTHVAGTIAQNTNNGKGVAGVAFGCSILPVKVLDAGGLGSYANISEGVRFAADAGARIINMSLSGPLPSTTLESAVAYAYNKGVTIVCSSGNKSGTSVLIGYPAAYDAYCIAVGATRYDESVTSYSKGGASLDLTAPGGDTSIDQNGDGIVDGILQETYYQGIWGYWLFQGTSMAAPHVSGVAALIISKGIATSPDAVRNILQTTAEDKGTPGWDSVYGWGIVDAYKALGGGSEPPAPTLTSIDVTPPSPSIVIGGTQQYTAIGTYSDQTTKDITPEVAWTSSVVSIATIDASGLATGVGAGTTSITATLGSITGTASLTVTNPPVTLTSIAVNPSNASIMISGTQQYTATGTYSDQTTTNITSSVTWASSNTSVATISSGLATGISAGTASITAALDGINSNTASLTVKKLLSIAVTAASSSIEVGGTQQFTATGTYSDQSSQDITTRVIWASSNTSIATISISGLATGVSAGTTDITATLDDVTSNTVSLTVTNPPVTLTSIAVTPSNASIAIGGTQQYTATGTYSDNSTTNITSSVTWASSNTSVATISSSGQATGVGVGTTSITATLGSITGTTSLTVTPGTLSATLSSMTFSTRQVGAYSYVKASVSVTVVNKQTSEGVGGVTVTGQWSGAARNSATGVTDTDGVAVLVSKEIRTKNPLKFTLALKKVVKTGWTFDGNYPTPVTGNWPPVLNSSAF